MNTPTHLVVGLAAAGRPGDRGRIAGAITGALVPDAALYLLVGYEFFLLGHPAEVIFRESYYTDGWQLWLSIGNSIPVYLALGLVALWRRAAWGVAFAVAALLHLALDFPLHNDDAYAHFWPISDWRFYSPLSYWDDEHFAGFVLPVELGLILGSTFWVVRRYRSLWLRGLSVVGALMLIGSGVFWALVF